MWLRCRNRSSSAYLGEGCQESIVWQLAKVAVITTLASRELQAAFEPPIFVSLCTDFELPAGTKCESGWQVHPCSTHAMNRQRAVAALKYSRLFSLAIKSHSYYSLLFACLHLCTTTCQAGLAHAFVVLLKSSHCRCNCRWFTKPGQLPEPFNSIKQLQGFKA